MHVGDVGDMKYLNKRSKATLYTAMLLMSEMSEMWNISMLCNYCTLMSETSEMWNISIKDQRQHYTQQCYSCRRCRRCEISQCYVITVLSCRRRRRCEISQYSNYIALRYFTSRTSPTWVTLLCIVLPLIFYWDISHLWRLWHETWVTLLHFCCQRRFCS